MKTKYPKIGFWITNGELGSFDNSKVYYSLHANGIRALKKQIQFHANRTGKLSWAELAQDFPEAKNRYYPRKPNN